MIHISAVLHKVMEAIRIARLERCRKLALERLQEIEKIVENQLVDGRVVK